VAKTSDNDKKLVKWSGNAGIEEASSAREELLKAFDEGKEVQLDITEVDDIDVSAIQIIIACFKEAAKRGIPFSIAGVIPEAIEEFCRSCGVSLSEFNMNKIGEVKNA